MKCSLLILILALPLISKGQSLSAIELKKINNRLSGKLQDTTRIHLLLKLSSHAITQIARISARDSAINFAKQAQELSVKAGYDSGLVKGLLREIKVWVLQAENEMVEGGDGKSFLSKAEPIQKRLIDFAKQKGTLDYQGETYTRIATLYDGNKTDFAGLLELYDSAATYFRRSNNRVRVSETLYFVGYMMASIGKWKESIPVYHRSISLVQPEGRPKLADVYGILGLTYTYMGSYSLSLKYQLVALKLAESEGDTTDTMGAVHLFLGKIYSRLNKPDLELAHYQKAYDIFQYYTEQHPGDFISIVVNIANCMIVKDPKSGIVYLDEFSKKYPELAQKPTAKRFMKLRYLQAYTLLKDYKKADEYCVKLLEEIDQYPEVPRLTIYITLFKYMLKSDQYVRAKKYLPQATELAHKRKSYEELKHLSLYESKIDSAAGNFRSAFMHYKLFKMYSDSVMSEAKSKEIAALEIEYETEKKEQAIALLTKDSDLKSRDLAQSQLMRNATLGGVLVLIVILGLGANQYRIKQKNNIELVNKQQEIQSKNLLLQQLVTEKEWFVKEIHHRTKNNLQTVVSLLESQSSYLQNSEALSAIQDSQNRVHAMSLIHQKLYRSDNMTSINMPSYIQELIQYLKDSFDVGTQIRFETSVGNIELDISQVIPVGLILNEAITNSIKYAFNEKAKDSLIQVSLNKNNGKVALSISDNGSGLPGTFNISSDKNGLGLKLMKGLAEDIEGEFQIKSEQGVTIHIIFVATGPLIKTVAGFHDMPITA
ncbi:MAG TPA: histidine kinase dimerization/phosphoacceptor domain -containing protein [Cyclobacteriaceae bacterium]